MSHSNNGNRSSRQSDADEMVDNVVNNVIPEPLESDSSSSESSYATAPNDGDDDEGPAPESTEQIDMRAQIRAIMEDDTIATAEKPRLIQRVMERNRYRNDGSHAGDDGEGVGDLAELPPGISVGACQYPVPTECEHYVRKNWIVSPCCGLIFGCRICHDEYWSSVESFADANSAAISLGSSVHRGPGLPMYDARLDAPAGVYENILKGLHTIPHVLDRFGIKEIICKKCNCRQGSGTNKCAQCSIKFSEYHCKICNLWMGADRQPFHCDGCGFCRVGGRDNFEHCDICCACIPTDFFDNHKCVGDKYKTNCPVCKEDLFSSRSPPMDLPCGHVIHDKCFRQLARFDYRCPLCKKSVIAQERMAPVWREIEIDIEMQPMPQDLSKIVTIICNDCERRSVDRPWHILGVQCSHCRSFNTAIEATTLTGEAAFSASAAHGDGDDVVAPIQAGESSGESFSFTQPRHSGEDESSSTSEEEND